MKTIKIRIPIAVDSEGNYNAVAWGGPQFASGGADPDDLVSSTREGLEPHGPETVVWVSAEIPLPEESEVVGNVEIVV